MRISASTDASLAVCHGAARAVDARGGPEDAAVVGGRLAEELHRVGRADLAGVVDVQAHLEGALVKGDLVGRAAAAHVDAPALVGAESHLLAGHETA